MRRDDVLDILSQHRSDLTQFKVSSLAIFGSVARDEAGAESDVDVLVEFAEPIGLLTFVGLQQYLEEILGTRVDLVTPDVIRSQWREQILQEAIRAA